MRSPETLKEWTPEIGSTRALLAEALGTALLTLAAAGAGSAYGAFGGAVGGAGAALAPGLTLAVLFLLFAAESQGHFNPAVSLGLALAGRLPKTRLLPYVAAQCAGGVAAGIFLRVILQSTVLGVSATQMNPVAALALEAFLAFWLVWVYLSVTERDFPPLNAALALGSTLAASVFWAGPLSSASMNPARSLGPALAAWEFSKLWLFILGPLAGGALAAFAYRAYARLGGRGA
jgi:glycerol uptake facilitator-like aquaporin